MVVIVIVRMFDYGAGFSVLLPLAYICTEGVSNAGC